MQKWWDGQESWGSKLSNDTINVYVTVPQIIKFYNNFDDGNFGPAGGSAEPKWF